ncbi:b(0,+)-type amino acid transporter 1-like [Bolinopsis microptera]|uniref:b(0,+)-type amino acid transporter 1-like n=1 Tax=Bolinopsis microptera TaxID=2820187 RepID=UPI00307A489D
MSINSEATEHTPLISSDNPESDESGSKSDKIQLFSCISVALSMMTGVGIFIFPNMVLQHVESGGASLVVWAIAGVVALLAGLCYSELSIALPGSGGELVYIQKVFGKAPANLFLLTSAFVKYPAITIIMTRTSFTYLMRCFTDFSFEVPPYQFVLSLAGIVIVVITCLMACYSTRLCTLTINALNLCKLAGILLILSFAVYVAITAPDKHEITERFSFKNTATNIPTILLSLFGAVASYEGWNCLNLVAGEVHNPQRTMPLAITIATCAAIVFYISCNVAYLTVLPLDVMKESTAVALDLGRLALGQTGQILLSVCVVASCLATVLGLVLCNSRLLQRAALDGQVPEFIKFTLIRTSTPIISILLHGFISSIFALITSLDALTTIVIIVSWLFYMLCFTAQLVLRFRDRLKPSFRVPTLIPMVLILFSLVLMVSPALSSVGKYRSFFTVTVILLAILTPISIISTLPSLRTSGNKLVQTSERLTRFIESSGSFS